MNIFCNNLIFKMMGTNYSKAMLFLTSLLVVSFAFSNENGEINFEANKDKITTKPAKNSKMKSSLTKENLVKETGIKNQKIAKPPVSLQTIQNNMAWTSADTCPTCDFDGDGIANNVDIDDDNDGVVDTLEMGASPVSSLIVPNASSVSHYWSNQSAFASRTYDENVTLTTTFGSDSYGTDQALVASNSWFSGAPNGTGVSYALKPFIADIVYNFA